MYKLNLNFTSHNGSPSETLTVALKVPGAEFYLQEASKTFRTLPENLEESITNEISRVHKTECYFYDEIAPLFNIKMPKIYATKEWVIGSQQGYILMDDLSEEGIVLSKYDSVSPGQIKAVVKEIAHLHAEVMKCPKNDKWNSVCSKNQEIWAKMTDEFVKLVPAFIELVTDKGRKNSLFGNPFSMGRCFFYCTLFSPTETARKKIVITQNNFLFD